MYQGPAAPRRPEGGAGLRPQAASRPGPTPSEASTVPRASPGKDAGSAPGVPRHLGRFHVVPDTGGPGLEMRLAKGTDSNRAAPPSPS